MTEYDYSPEAYDRYLATQDRIAKWVDTTERHRPEFQAPFGHQRPLEESSSSRNPASSTMRHDDRVKEDHHHSRRHSGHDHESHGSSSRHSREYDAGPSHHASRSHPPPPAPRQSQPHHHEPPVPGPLQQHYADRHIQIYGPPAAVQPPVVSVLPQQPKHASYSYAGPASPPPYPYPPTYDVPSGADLLHKSNSKSKKSKRAHSHQPASAPFVPPAAFAPYYDNSGYTSPPGVAHGYPSHAYPPPPPPPVSSGRRGKGGYLVVDHSHQPTGVSFMPHAQYPPVVPVMYRTR